MLGHRFPSASQIEQDVPLFFSGSSARETSTVGRVFGAFCGWDH